MNIIGIIVGLCLCFGNIIGYVPQFYNIVYYKSIEGISEMSLTIMNIAFMFLSMNILIYSWQYFSCTNFECAIQLFPFVQIALSWVMVLIFYIIFVIYKYQRRDKYAKRWLYGFHYTITYLFFIMFVVTLSIGEKYGGHDPLFFQIFADVLGYSSAILNSIVYIPQIYTIFKIKSGGNLSFLMYIIQTPGNLIIIYFQAILYENPVSTWITYAIIFVEQVIILSLMTYYHYYPLNDLSMERTITEEIEEIEDIV